MSKHADKHKDRIALFPSPRHLIRGLVRFIINSGGIMDNFIIGFCKVEFLCYAGSPNWLGWGLLGFGALVLLLICIMILS